MTIEGCYMKATEGKVFRRIGTDEIMGEDIYLGLSFYIGGVLQDPPHQDVPEDFEEIDPPEPLPEPEPEPEISAEEALSIITGREDELH